MSADDYIGIRTQLTTIFAGGALTSGVSVFIEEEPQVGLADLGRCIAVFSMNRTAPPGEQNIASGKRTKWHWRLGVWVLAFSFTSFEEACVVRDTLLSNTELVLMKDRTIGGKANMLWLEGGEMYSARDDGGSGVFMAAAETVLVIDVSAINS